VKSTTAVDVVAVFDDTIVAVKRCEHRPRLAIPSPILDDRRALPYLAGSLVAHFVLLGLLVFAPGDGGGIGLDLGTLEPVATSGELALPVPAPSGSDEASAESAAAEAAVAMQLPSHEPTRTSEPAASDATGPRVSREEALASAREAGILGSTSLAGSFAPLTGRVDVGNGFDDMNIYGGIIGNEAGELSGEFGVGRSGFGPGCDSRCIGWGTIGSGRYGTVGRGLGTGEGYGFAGGGYGRITGRESQVPTVVICGRHEDGTSCVVSEGGLDKALIRRYIRRHLDEVRYCYEKELLATPGLAGTVVAEFVINPDGTVIGSTAHGMDDAIDSCVAGVMGSIAFPAAKTHTATSVKYPFELRAL